MSKISGATWRQNFTEQELEFIDLAYADAGKGISRSQGGWGPAYQSVAKLAELLTECWPDKASTEMGEREFAGTKWIALKAYRDEGAFQGFNEVLKLAYERCSDDQWKQLMRWLAEHQSLRTYGGES